MATFTISGVTAQDVEDFAYSKGYRDLVGEEPNPVSKAQYCKDYVRNMFRNDIKAYRFKVLKAAVAQPVEPDIIVE